MNATAKVAPPMARAAHLSPCARVESDLSSYLRAVKSSDRPKRLLDHHLAVESARERLTDWADLYDEAEAAKIADEEAA